MRKDLVRVNQVLCKEFSHIKERSSEADACQVMRDQKWPLQAWREGGKEGETQEKSDSNGKNRAEEEWNAWLIHSECSKVPEVHYNVTIIITFHQNIIPFSGLLKHSQNLCNDSQCNFHFTHDGASMLMSNTCTDGKSVHLFLLVNFKNRTIFLIQVFFFFYWK